MNKLRQNEGQDDGEALRNEAIDMYLQGMKPTTICRILGRSRTWFYQTLKRYQQGGRVELKS